MSKLTVENGITSLVLRIFVQDTSLTNGGGKTGLDHTSTGMQLSLIADNESSATVYTVAAGNLETITTLGTYAAPTSGKARFKAVDDTNLAGIYELHIANARWAVSGARSVQGMLFGASGAAPCPFEIQLAAVPANVQKFGGNDGTFVSGKPDVNVAASVTGAVGSVTGNVGGNVVGSVASVSGNVGGNVNGSVASVAGNVSGSVASVTGAVGSVTGSVGSVVGAVGGSVASVSGAVGSVTGNVGGDVAGKVLGGGAGTISGDGVRAQSVTGAVGSVTGSVGGNVTGTVGGIAGTLQTLDALWNKTKAWLGALAGKTADTATRAEINATTAGATYNETTDALEAIRDRGDAAWTTGAGGAGGEGQGAEAVVVAAIPIGATVGWPKELVIDDAYLETTQSAPKLFIKDIDGNILAGLGSKTFADEDFVGTLRLSPLTETTQEQDRPAATIEVDSDDDPGIVFNDDTADAEFFLLQIPHAKTALGVIRTTYSAQFIMNWGADRTYERTVVLGNVKFIRKNGAAS